MQTNALTYEGKIYLLGEPLTNPINCLPGSNFEVIRKYYNSTVQTSSLAPLFKNLVPANSFDLRAISVTYIGRP